MDRKYEVGDWVEYRFCGGTSYAYINAYKWYIPKAYENRNGEMTYPEPHVVYLCSKLYGMSSGVPYFGTKMYHAGTKELSEEEKQLDYHWAKSTYPELWAQNLRPYWLPYTNQTLPVYQVDIERKFNWEDKTIKYSDRSYHYRNPFYWLDKDKYEKERLNIPPHMKEEIEETLQHYIKRFEERKSEVLKRKLCQ